MKQGLKQIAKKVYTGVAPFFFYVPFVNLFQLNGAKILRNKAILIKNKISVKGTGNSILLSGNNHLHNCHVFIRGNNNHIIIGKNTKLRNVELWIEDDNNNIIIGDNCSFMGKCHIACIEGTVISIGDNCLLSANITFRSGDSHSIIDKTTGERINHSKNITVHDNVWIASNVTICKGVVIPCNSIVATGSILTKSISEQNSIIAGVPGTVVKSNVAWKRERL